MSEQILTNENMVQQVDVKYYVRKNGRTSATQAEFEKADQSSACSNLISVVQAHTIAQNIPQKSRQIILNKFFVALNPKGSRDLVVHVVTMLRAGRSEFRLPAG